MLDGYYVKKIGQNRGTPRVWLEGTQTARAGFEPGQRFDVAVRGQTVVLQANPDGTRVVSGKKIGERNNPVIDINSRELLAIFDGMSAVRVAVRKGEIYLLPLASEIKKRERFQRLRAKLESGDSIAIGSLSHGGGILSNAVHAGLREAGIPSRLAFANEVREELLEHAALHNDAWSSETKVFAAPMQELAFDDRGVAHLPKVEILEMGLPCDGASKAGMAKRGLKHPEGHPDVGHLVVSALVILSKANAAIVVLENVPNYAQSASADILRNQLRDMGYVTHERILNGRQWGALENRDRWCMVAVTAGIAFDFSQLQPPVVGAMRLGDALDQVAADDPHWSRMTGLRAKEVRDAAAGKGFRMQVFDADSEHIGTITKGYAKVRSTDPKIQHPTDPELLRQLSPAEHARIKQVPPQLIEGLSATMAHEVLGQGIVYSPFRDLGQHIGNSLNAMVARPRRELANRQGMQDGPYVEAGKSAGGDDGDVAMLAAEVVGTWCRAAPEGRYSGPIVAVDGDVVIQGVGRRDGVVHARAVMDRMPQLGEVVQVVYKNGRARVKAIVGQQIGLGL